MKLRSQSPQAGQIVCGVVAKGSVKEGKIGSSLVVVYWRTVNNYPTANSNLLSTNSIRWLQNNNT